MTQSRVEYLGVFFVALLLRALYLQGAWQGNELIDYPIVDAHVYVDWAKRILDGGLLWNQSSNYTPIYPLYLASWIGLLGDRTFTIFLLFHVIGAAQAVIIGLIAEEVWDWKEGLLASFLAATYWPFVVFEASFYAEAFALWTASLGLLLLIRAARTGSIPGFLAAGFFLGLAGLVRANLLLCFPVLCLWLFVRQRRAPQPQPQKRKRRSAPPPRQSFLAAARPALALVLPVVLLSAPIVAWNLRVTDRAILRSQSGVTLFLGNNPDFGGLVVRPGVQWRDLMIDPLRAGKTSSREKEEYWRERTFAVIQERPADWLVLQWKKLSMHLGAFEVSQEIDVPLFRRSSPILALPIWPGFGLVMPLALAGMVVALRRREQAALPLVLFALTYTASLMPFQAAARYRLPLLVVLIPLAAHLLVWAWDRLRAGEWRQLLPACGVLALSFALVIPDYTDLADRNRVRHEHSVGVKYYEQGDFERALWKFGESASFDEQDADSPLWMGQIHLEQREFVLAKADFAESRRRYRPNPEALLGLAEVAIEQADYPEARKQVQRALTEWPHSQPGFRLLKEIALRQGDWPALHTALTKLSGYSNVEAGELSQLAIVSETLGDFSAALSAHARLAGNPLFESADRVRALFSSGLLRWRHFGDADAATEAWRPLAGRVDFVHGALAAYLLGALDDVGLAANIPQHGLGSQYLRYAQGLAAWLGGDSDGARRAFQAIVDERGAGSLPLSGRTEAESWALADLEKL